MQEKSRGPKFFKKPMPKKLVNFREFLGYIFSILLYEIDFTIIFLARMDLTFFLISGPICFVEKEDRNYCFVEVLLGNPNPLDVLHFENALGFFDYNLIHMDNLNVEHC